MSSSHIQLDEYTMQFFEYSVKGAIARAARTHDPLLPGNDQRLSQFGSLRYPWPSPQPRFQDWELSFEESGFVGLLQRIGLTRGWRRR